MYACPICNKVFLNKDDVAKHSLKCWKEQNPYHKSKSALHSPDIEERIVNNEVFNFFTSLQERK